MHTQPHTDTHSQRQTDTQTSTTTHTDTHNQTHDAHAPKPKYNERVPRQHRCELPPEFLLILLCSGVDHLSGPGTCALSSSTLKITGLRLHFEHPETYTHVGLLTGTTHKHRLTPHRHRQAHTDTQTHKRRTQTTETPTQLDIFKSSNVAGIPCGT